MWTRAQLISVLGLSIVVLACHSVSVDRDEPRIRSEVISVDELSAEFDSTRTFQYRVGQVEDPEELLHALWDAGIRSSRAWQPLDDRCLDPVGPRFTLELVRDDPRIIEYGFERGTGRLHCATRLLAFTVG